MTLPILDREPIRPILDSEIDKEIWQPDWVCFCCHDTGLITGCLVDLIIPNYDAWKDKPVACQFPRCKAGHNFRHREEFDQRFDRDICTELYDLHREDWRKTILAQFKGAKQRRLDEEIANLAKEKEMTGTRGRSANDDREVEIKRFEFEKPPLEQAVNSNNIETLLQDG